MRDPQQGRENGKHFLGEVAFSYGLLITPTCDMAEQHGTADAAHPFRVLVPVLPLAQVAAEAGGVEKSVKLLRSRDTIHPYMYLPPLEGVLAEESVACLYRPSLVSDELLADPPRRVAQLQPEARRHLKVKLAAYWAYWATPHPARAANASTPFWPISLPHLSENAADA